MMRRKQAAIKYQPLPQIVFAPHLKKKAGVTPFALTKTLKIKATVGIQFFTFAFQDLGGTGSLLPGAGPNPVSKTLKWPKGATMAVVFLAAFNVGYFDQSGNLVDHHLGQLIVNLGFTGPNTVTCTFLLRDSSTSEGVEMFASGVVLYFDAA